MSIAVFLSPQKNDPVHGPWFVAAVADDNESTSDVLGLDSLPELWEKHFQEHRVPVEMLSDIFKVEALPDITHLVVLESDLQRNDPFYFGRTAIRHNSLMCWRAKDGTYRYFHCEQCAASALVWITENQEQWSRPLN